jgi:hypothetical protein
VDSNVLAYAMAMIRYRHLPVHSVLVERHGKIVLDAYFHPFADNQLHDVASVTKTVLSTLVGIAHPYCRCLLSRRRQIPMPAKRALRSRICSA